MRHTHYKAVDIKTGKIAVRPFSYIDGSRFGVSEDDFIRFNGFDGETALLIVNRWNYITTLQINSSVAEFYFVHSIEGAN